MIAPLLTGLTGLSGLRLVRGALDRADLRAAIAAVHATLLIEVAPAGGGEEAGFITAAEPVPRNVDAHVL